MFCALRNTYGIVEKIEDGGAQFFGLPITTRFPGGSGRNAALPASDCGVGERVPTCAHNIRKVDLLPIPSAGMTRFAGFQHLLDVPSRRSASST